MGNKELRSSLMGGLWMVLSFALIALFIGSGLQGEMTLWHVAFGMSIITLAIVGTFFLMRYNFGESELEKAKRQRIDNFLRDLSDDDLLHLKQRLADGKLQEEAILDYLTDDGELIIRE